MLQKIKLTAATYLQKRGILVLFVFLILSVLPKPSAAQNAGQGDLLEGKMLESVRIVLPPGETRSGYWEETARKLISLKPGGRFTSDELVKTLSMLSDSNLFSKIQLDDPESVEGGLSLIFHLTPYARIRSIDIDGAFPYFSKEILNVISIRPGDVFVQDQLENQKERIKTFFKNEGYIDPGVEVTVIPDGSDGGYVIAFTVEKGSYYKVVSVDFQGLLQLRPTDFNIRTRRMTASRLNRKQARDDEKQILQICRKKGFADAVVSLRIEMSDQTARIIFKVEEGPRYRLEIEGNREISRRELEKAVVWNQEGDRHRFGVGKAIRSIRKIYEKRGFIKARVGHRIDEMRENGQWIRTVTLLIEEGQEHRIADVVVKGAERISEQAIRERIFSLTGSMIGQPVYDPGRLEQDINEIRILYLNNGFLSAAVDKSIQIRPLQPQGESDRANVRIDIHIREGTQTLIQSVDFTCFPKMDAKEARQMISAIPGKPFRRFMLESDENILKAYILEMGYPHVSIKADTSISPDAAQARIVFACDPGPFVTMGTVIYAGNFRTQSSVLDDEIKPGSSLPLSLTQLTHIRRKLSDMEAMDAVRFRTPGLKEKASTVHIVAEVSEKKPYYVELETGYDTRRRAYIRSGAGDHNFLGRNLDLNGGMEVSQIGYQLNMGIKEPNFLASGVSSVSEIFLDEKEELNKDFGTRTSGLSQEFAWSFLDDKLTVSVGGSWRYQEIYATALTFFSEDPDRYQGERTVLSAGPAITFRTTDSFVRPTKGVLLTSDMNISRGIEDDMDSFIRYRFDGRYYVTPLKRLTLAFRGRYGIVQGYGNRSLIPEDQLFFLGGTSSIRGFDENKLSFDENGNALGGKQMMALSVEARVDVHDRFELALFVDSGSITGTQTASGTDDFRISVGTGIRYHTPIGPISFLYGHKLDPRPGEDAGAFHFSMGYTF